MPDPTNNQSNTDTKNPQQTPPVFHPPVDIPAMPDLISSTQVAPPPSDEGSNGSSAPAVSFPDLPIDEPKKKFGGGKGKIIATILGILMLVGGVGAGAYLTLQNQNPNEKAANIDSCSAQTTSKDCSNTCSPEKGTPPTSYKCQWLSAQGKCNETSQPCGGSGGTTAPERTACTGVVGDSGYYNINGVSYAYCGGCVNECVRGDVLVASGGCNFYVSAACNTPVDYGGVKCSYDPIYSKACGTRASGTDPDSYDDSSCPDQTKTIYFDKTGYCNKIINNTQQGLCGMVPGCMGVSNAPTPPGWDPSKPRFKCDSNGCVVYDTATCFVRRYTCSGNNSLGGGCQPGASGYIASETKGPATSLNFDSNRCDVVQQIDVGCTGAVGHVDSVSRVFPACTPPPKPDTPPPATPSPTPLVTAQCQNVTAYSPTWTVLTASQLAQKKTGDVVNICVVGSASAGIFDKAKFTINGIAQAETVTKRPNTQDFCQSYTIPANTYSFRVTAQIHHSTLGWK